MIKAVIFDLDGVIIDSEPLWREAEIKVFTRIGIQLTTEQCKQTTGLSVAHVVAYWYIRKAWQHKSQEKIVEEIIEEVIQFIQIKGNAKPGVDRIIDYFTKKDLPLAIASSSCMKIIKTVLEKLKICDKFAAVYSGEFIEYSKPHPDIYLSTAKGLNVNPRECLVFEDSFYGALAAKAAGMNVIAVLEEEDFEKTKFDFSDLKIKSFLEFTDKHFSFFNSL